MISLSHVDLLSIGFYCAMGADQLFPYIQRLSANTDILISVHPNAGLPNAFGEYDQSPKEMKELITPYVENNLVNIIGGCCGTGPEHIQEIASLVANYKPR